MPAALLQRSRTESKNLVFVHIAGTSFWRLLCYSLFQLRSKPDPDISDGITAQQQAILRNSTSSMASVHGFVRIIRRTGNVRKSLGLLSLALVNFIGFVLAGIFSSRVTSATSDVLLKPTNCGRWWAFSFDHKLVWHQS